MDFALLMQNLVYDRA